MAARRLVGGDRTMARKWSLVVAGLAVTAVAGCSTAGMHASGSAQVPGKQVVAAQQARMVTPSGQAAFRKWWVSGGYRQDRNVANDLSILIIRDTPPATTDHATFDAEARHLA